MSNAKRKLNYTQIALWCVYLCLLAVLLPHTAWAFSQFEPDNTLGTVISWFAAFAFEAALAVLTHKLSERIANAPRRKGALARFRFAYLSPYSLGLLLTTSVSVAANLAHSVEYGRTMQIFATYRIPPLAYSVAFGAVLPLASLLFAWVLSQENAIEEVDDESEHVINELRSQLRAMARKVSEAEGAANGYKQQLDISKQQAFDISKLLDALALEAKAERIKAVASLPAELSGSQIARLTGASPGYVSDVLSKNGNGVS